MSFNVDKINATLFMTYLVSLKRADNTYFTFPCYDGKRSACVHLISETGNHLSDSFREELSYMLISLKKTFVKDNSNRGLHISEGKEYMTFECYHV